MKYDHVRCVMQRHTVNYYRIIAVLNCVTVHRVVVSDMLEVHNFVEHNNQYDSMEMLKNTNYRII